MRTQEAPGSLWPCAMMYATCLHVPYQLSVNQSKSSKSHTRAQDRYRCKCSYTTAIDTHVCICVYKRLLIISGHLPWCMPHVSYQLSVNQSKSSKSHTRAQDRYRCKCSCNTAIDTHLCICVYKRLLVLSGHVLWCMPHAISLLSRSAIGIGCGECVWKEWRDRNAMTMGSSQRTAVLPHTQWCAAFSKRTGTWYIYVW